MSETDCVFLDGSHFSVKQLASLGHDSHLGKRCLAFNYTNQGNRLNVRDDQWDAIITTNRVFIGSIRMKMVVEVESQQPLATQTQNTARGERSVSKPLEMGNHRPSTPKSSPYQYTMGEESSATTIIFGFIPKSNLTSWLRKFLSTVLFPICYECL